MHVIDLDPSSVTSGGWLEDTSLVEKYKISEEAYNKREGIYPTLELEVHAYKRTSVLCTIRIESLAAIR